MSISEQEPWARHVAPAQVFEELDSERRGADGRRCADLVRSLTSASDDASHTQGTPAIPVHYLPVTASDPHPTTLLHPNVGRALLAASSNLFRRVPVHRARHSTIARRALPRLRALRRTFPVRSCLQRNRLHSASLSAVQPRLAVGVGAVCSIAWTTLARVRMPAVDSVRLSSACYHGLSPCTSDSGRIPHPESEIRLRVG